MLNPVIGFCTSQGNYPAVHLSQDGYACTVGMHQFNQYQDYCVTLRAFVTLIACNVCVWLDSDSAQQLEKSVSIITHKLSNICYRRPDGNFSFHAELAQKTRFTGKPEDFQRHFAVVYKTITYALSNEGATTAELVVELDRLLARERKRARSKTTSDCLYFAE